MSTCPEPQARRPRRGGACARSDRRPDQQRRRGAPPVGGFLSITDEDWTQHHEPQPHGGRADAPRRLRHDRRAAAAPSSPRARSTPFSRPGSARLQQASKAAVANFSKSLSKEVASTTSGSTRSVRVLSRRRCGSARVAWRRPWRGRPVGTLLPSHSKPPADAATGRFTTPEEVADLDGVPGQCSCRQCHRSRLHHRRRSDQDALTSGPVTLPEMRPLHMPTFLTEVRETLVPERDAPLRSTAATPGRHDSRHGLGRCLQLSPLGPRLRRQHDRQRRFPRFCGRRGPGLLHRRLAGGAGGVRHWGPSSADGSSSGSGHHRAHHVAVAAATQALLLAVAVILALVGTHPFGSGVRYALIVFLALAMGVQNSSVRRLAIPRP